ncbi:putative U3 small nucleolar ribonucleoprotein IMP4 [Giardia duodenalis]|uniref:U3 small nucleolar ribonucleoprotein IMP4 n=1 Tax=Giardia intestinalis (strain ATCC 50803 / WB clone C6) TaxID=184922 RepID=A8BJ58_GIAIC|nr:putative U3 small nucleolar ribonucleoprotein IMP4 [Giardia intestinalis]KAE8304873.1 putative U3 small nucleolar ribonucleoprotein IMP4 [Giardia intestinalis]|eukprot:XP_001706746.1 U3 small nucleolar ribonucleoprotein protein IMP4, putative [Giardia lamblia ATCC 50803]
MTPSAPRKRIFSSYSNPFRKEKPLGMKPARPIDEEIQDLQSRTPGNLSIRHNPSRIRNRLKRLRIVQEVRDQKLRVKRELHRRRDEQEAQLRAEGKDITSLRKPRLTLDSKRDEDATMTAHAKEVVAEELVHAETLDEFGEYFDGTRIVKVAITTSVGCKNKGTLQFIDDFIKVLGGVISYIPREELQIRQLAVRLIDEGFTSVIIVHEDRDIITHMMMMALPAGPTAWFRMTNVYTHKELVGSGVPIPDCPPEVIMNNFKTRLGRRVGRMIQSMLSREEHLRARQVITFHNQRDFIFFRAYRYIFENKDKKDPTSEVIVRMHELGPQFTLKLKWLQKGLFDPHNEEYEWFYKPEMDHHSRTRFFL